MRCPATRTQGGTLCMCLKHLHWKSPPRDRSGIHWPPPENTALAYTPRNPPPWPPNIRHCCSSGSLIIQQWSMCQGYNRCKQMPLKGHRCQENTKDTTDSVKHKQCQFFLLLYCDPVQDLVCDHILGDG